MFAYEIDGITVKFPHEAYELQQAAMQCVIRALIKQENALIESPTGTGKGLTLLCSVMAYLKHQRRLDPKSQLVVYYASRTHSQLTQIVKELRQTEYATDTRPCVLGSRD